MLTITKMQMAALDGLALRLFEQRVSGLIRSAGLAADDLTDTALADFVRESVQVAKRYNFTTERQIVRFTVGRLLIGQQLRQHYHEAQEVLTSPDSSELRSLAFAQLAFRINSENSD